MPFVSPEIDAAARCRSCLHSLSGLAEPVCPECGLPFDFDKPITWRDTRDDVALLRRLRSPPGWIFNSTVVAIFVYTAWKLSPLIQPSLWEEPLVPFVLVVGPMGIWWCIRLCGLLLTLALRGLVPRSPKADAFSLWIFVRWAAGPMLAVATVLLAITDIPRRVRWTISESSMRSAAEAALRAAPPNCDRFTFQINAQPNAMPIIPPDGFIGSVPIEKVVVEQGHVRFKTRPDESLCYAELLYTPDGVAPWTGFPGGRYLSPDWEIRHIDPF